MANLNSIDNKYAIKINLIRYEDSSDEWLIIKLVLVRDAKNIIETIGSFVRKSELITFQEAMQQIIDCKEKKIESHFLEPNLNIKINKLKNSQFQVNVTFLEIIDYENGTVNKENEKDLTFLTKNKNICVFIDELTAEIKKIK